MQLSVPGGSLHVEVTGAGPALLLIIGGSGDAGAFAPLVGRLAPHRTVIGYDRRGFSRSPLAADALAGRYLDDVEDAARVIDAYAPGGRADVFGSSSGAILALDLLRRHPGRVGTVIAHEPPLTALVPEGPAIRAGFDEVVALLHTEGPEAAMRHFGTVIGVGFQAPPPRAVLPAPVVALLDRMDANVPMFIEHELRQYTRRDPDPDSLRAFADRIVAAVGVASGEQFPAAAGRALAGALGVEAAEFPGDHIGYVLEPTAFADRLLQVT